MKYLSFRHIISAIAVASIIAVIGKGIAYDHHYKTVCLGGFSENLNKEGIAQSYAERGSIIIAPDDIIIVDVSPDRGGLSNYRYRTADGLYFGMAIGHNCGVYDVLPDDRDAWFLEKFGGGNSIAEPKTKAFQL